MEKLKEAELMRTASHGASHSKHRLPTKSPRLQQARTMVLDDLRVPSFAPAFVLREMLGRRWR